MSHQRAANIYSVPESSLHDRINGKTPIHKRRNSQRKLTPSKEQTLIQYVLDLDTQGFPPQIVGVKDMANLLLATHRAQSTSIH